MKFRFSLILAHAVNLALAGSLCAAGYYTDFEDFDYGDMTTPPNSAKGWTINDSAPDASFIQFAGSAPIWGGASATLGYVAPLQNTQIYLSRAVSVPLTTGTGTTFSTKFQVVDSVSGANGAGARDTFGFRLQNTTGDNLFSFYLNPFDQDPTPQTDTAFHTFSWSTGNGVPTVVLDSPPVAAQETFAYTFTVNFFDIGGGDVGFDADVNGSEFSGTLTGLATENIGRLGAFWNLTNTTYLTDPGDPLFEEGYYGGSNFLIFDNVNLVPEPSSALLLGLAALGFVTRRRRA
jgi:hypothetical protein